MADNEPKSLYRLILADDNKEIRDVIVRLLDDTYEVVGAVADGAALVDAVSELEPDVGIVDISMPVMSGIHAAAEIRRRGSAMKIIFLTVNEDSDFVQAAFELGASGYVLKRQMASDLPDALEAAAEGRTFVSSCFKLADDNYVGR